jgi:hypothetical protein
MGNEIPEYPTCPGCIDYLPDAIYVTYLSDNNAGEGFCYNSISRPDKYNGNLENLYGLPIAATVIFCYESTDELRAIFIDFNFDEMFELEFPNNGCKIVIGGTNPVISIIF